MMKKSIRELTPALEELYLPREIKKSGNRVNILALGDVGATLLMGMKLLGGDTVESIGIFDVNENVQKRYEIEMNQIGCPFEGESTVGANMPKVEIIGEKELFDCDMFVFCASKAVPDLGAKGDVRMMQLDANKEIVSHYGKMAGEAGFTGIFAVVSDPVDPLCKAAYLSSGLNPAQIKGYGLGVMNRRAMYYAGLDEKYSTFLKEGRVFGPHGGDLVVANSIENYDEKLSEELTEKTVGANLVVRGLGFKPYYAPAMSSGAISLLLTLRGEWNYSSLWFGSQGEGAFLGIKNRIDDRQCRFEDLELPEALYKRIEKAYINLKSI